MMSATRHRLLRAMRAACLGFIGLGSIVVLGSAPALAEKGSATIPQRQAPEGAPNVVIVLLDDVGFGATSTFGGPADTPALEVLAQDGLRYNRFHTTGICSPTRASLLTGRDAHVTGVGTVLNSANDRPGYEGVLRPETAVIAEVLRQQGYSTGAFGKWHLAPDWEISPAGPFDRWPTGVGFETFYGFLGGETDQYDPVLYSGTTPIQRPAREGYHLTEDLVDQAIHWMRAQHSIRPDQPFFMYLAPGATHAPLQVPQEWLDRYKGRFDQGWDAMREQIFARQKELGVIPADSELTPRPEQIPAWDSLGADEQRVAARLMETYVAFLAHTDAQVGRLVQALKDSGQYDNTLFIYIVGDNGSSPEGGIRGGVSYMGTLQGLPEPTALQLRRLDDIGSPDSYAQYPVGWGWALTTPFQWVKQVSSHLGATRNPMVVTWPQQIKDRGGIRSQFSHVNDIVPTILEAAGIAAPKKVNGVRQLPMDGSSMLPSFLDANAAEHHRTQYFEVHGNRSIYHDGWMASAFHGRLPWTVGVRGGATPFEEDQWELYNLEDDFSQARNLAEKNPAKLKAMQKRFDKEARRVGILPLHNALDRLGEGLPSLVEGRTEFVYYPGTVGIPESGAPPLLNRSWTLQADIDARDDVQGVVAAMGGRAAGWSVYVDAEGFPVFEYRTFEVDHMQLRGQQPLSGRQLVEVEFDYDGEGYAKGAEVRLKVEGEAVAKGRLVATPPAFFSIDETFDIGIDLGAPAGQYPADSALGYPFSGGEIGSVRVRLR